MRKSGRVAPGDEDEVWARRAARNNAALCDAVSRAHGCDGLYSADAWTSAQRTPPFYPDAVTLDPDVDAGALLARIDRSPGASVKDSFCTLDLAPHGFRILFEAEWVFRAAEVSATVGGCSTVADADALAEWERAWAGDDPPRGLFPPSLLAEPDIVFLRRGAVGAVAAGAVVNRSAAVVGISNVFAPAGGLVDAWTGLVSEVSVRFPDCAMVGYEPLGSLDAARGAGFRSIGRLRIWIDDE